MNVWEAIFAYLAAALSSLTGGLHFLEAEFTDNEPGFPYGVLENVGQQQANVALAEDGGHLRARVTLYSLSKAEAADLAEEVAAAFRALRGLHDGWWFDHVVIRDGRHLPLAMPGHYRWYVDAAITYRSET